MARQGMDLTDFTVDKSNWRKVKLGDVVAESRDTVKDFSAEQIDHVVGLEHIDSEDIHLRRSANITDSGTTFNKKFAAGDVLFGRRRAYLKKAAQANFSGICSGDITVLRAKDGLLTELLPFVINNDKFFDYAIKHSAGSLSPRVKFKDLADYEFLLPPKDQQAQLAELLWAMDSMSVENENLFNKFDGFFQSWLNGEINNQKGWARKPLSQVAHVQTGIAKNENLKEEKGNLQLPYLRVANVQDGYLDLDEVKLICVKEKDVARFSLKEGDLLLTEGGDFDKLGRGYVWHGEIQNCLHQNHIFAVRADKKTLLPFFLSLITRSKYGKQFFLSCAKKTSNLASINSTQLKEFKVFVPPLSEQEAIVERMKAINSTHEVLQKYKLSLVDLQKSLINQIF